MAKSAGIILQFSLPSRQQQHSHAIGGRAATLLSRRRLLLPKHQRGYAACEESMRCAALLIAPPALTCAIGVSGLNAMTSSLAVEPNVRSVHVAVIQKVPQMPCRVL